MKTKLCFPTAINWTTERVKKRNAAEFRDKAYGRGRLVDMKQYQRLITVAEQEMDEYSNRESQVAPNPLTNPTLSSPTSACTQCPHCRIQQHPPSLLTPFTSKDYALLIRRSLEDLFQTHPQQCSLQEVLQYIGCEQLEPTSGSRKDSTPLATPQQVQPSSSGLLEPDPAIEEAMVELEAIITSSLEKEKARPTTIEAPSFSLGIESPSQRLKKSNQVPSVLGASSATCTLAAQVPAKSKKLTYHDETDVVNKQDAEQTKKMPTRQQPTRLARQVPYACRSPYLKDYKEASHKLNHDQLILVDYAFLPANDTLPGSEHLFELDHEDESKRLWVTRDTMQTLSGKDLDLDNSIIDVMAAILNWKELTRRGSPKRYFFSTYVNRACQEAIDKEEDVQCAFERVVNLEVERCHWITLHDADLVFFPILVDYHYIVLCLEFNRKIIRFLNNRRPREDELATYHNCAMMLVNSIYNNYLQFIGHGKGHDLRKFKMVNSTLPWQSNKNIHDCRIYAIRHMETFYGGKLKDWRPGFEKAKTQSRYIIQLRVWYCAMILESPINKIKPYVQVKATSTMQQQE